MAHFRSLEESGQSSVWESSTDVIPMNAKNGRNDFDQETNEIRIRRDRSIFLKYFCHNCCCCCSCSAPLIVGLILGGLIAGIVLATVLSLYLVGPHKTTFIMTNTGTSTTATTATSTSTTASSSTTSLSSSSSTSSTTISTSTSVTTSTLTTITTTSVTITTTSSVTTTTTTLPYCTTRVTFDDIPNESGMSGVVPNGYDNLNWTNVQYVNASMMPLSGYQYGVSSPPYVANSPTGANLMISSANGSSFAFNSVVVTAAWRDNLVWSIYGYRLGVNYVAGSLLVTVFNQSIITCGGCYNLDTLIFTSSGGTPHPGLAQNGTQFAFDDLCISFGY